MASEGITLTAGDAEATVRPDNGCRVQSLKVRGVELLRQGERYGCFPMVPWCGRLGNGQFRNGADVHQMPQNSPPHAIHGTSRDLAWRTARATSDEAVCTYDLADPWPYTGRVTQRVQLAADRLTLTLAVETYASSFPAQTGWHPWFLRTLDGDGGTAGPSGAPGDGGEGVRIDFAPAWQEVRGADLLPTGERIAPAPGPWDDCFGMPDGVHVTLTWPGRLELTVSSREQWVVVYDEQESAVCVEPQSGPPNGLNTHPRLVTPIDPLETTMTLSWREL